MTSEEINKLNEESRNLVNNNYINMLLDAGYSIADYGKFFNKYGSNQNIGETIKPDLDKLIDLDSKLGTVSANGHKFREDIGDILLDYSNIIDKYLNNPEHQDISSSDRDKCNIILNKITLLRSKLGLSDVLAKAAERYDKINKDVSAKINELATNIELTDEEKMQEFAKLQSRLATANNDLKRAQKSNSDNEYNDELDDFSFIDNVEANDKEIQSFFDELTMPYPLPNELNDCKDKFAKVTKEYRIEISKNRKIVMDYNALLEKLCIKKIANPEKRVEESQEDTLDATIPETETEEVKEETSSAIPEEPVSVEPEVTPDLEIITAAPEEVKEEQSSTKPEEPVSVEPEEKDNKGEPQKKGPVYSSDNLYVIYNGPSKDEPVSIVGEELNVGELYKIKSKTRIFGQLYYNIEGCDDLIPASYFGEYSKDLYPNVAEDYLQIKNKRNEPEKVNNEPVEPSEEIISTTSDPDEVTNVEENPDIKADTRGIKMFAVLGLINKVNEHIKTAIKKIFTSFAKKKEVQENKSLANFIMDTAKKVKKLFNLSPLDEENLDEDSADYLFNDSELFDTSIKSRRDKRKFIRYISKRNEEVASRDEDAESYITDAVNLIKNSEGYSYDHDYNELVAAAICEVLGLRRDIKAKKEGDRSYSFIKRMLDMGALDFHHKTIGELTDGIENLAHCQEYFERHPKPNLYYCDLIMAGKLKPDGMTDEEIEDAASNIILSDESEKIKR